VFTTMNFGLFRRKSHSHGRHLPGDLDGDGFYTPEKDRNYVIIIGDTYHGGYAYRASTFAPAGIPCPCLRNL